MAFNPVIKDPRPWFRAKLHAMITSISNLATPTYTSGSAPTPGTTQTIADSTAPTVVELLQYIANLHAKVNALTSALQA
jgi:hypothetical protein